MNTNDVMTPSFGAALSIMRRSFNLKAPIQFPSLNQNTSTQKDEPERLTTNSLNDLSNDPSFRLTVELRKNSHYHFAQGNSTIKEESPISAPLEELSHESKKFAEARSIKTAFKPEGDVNSDVSPDEIYDGSNKTNTTTPINISLIRMESIFEKDKHIIPITPQVRSALDFTKEPSTTKASKKRDPASQKTGGTKLNVFTRGLQHLRKSLTRKTVKKENTYQMDSESAMNMIMERPEVQRSQAHYLTWSHTNNLKKLGEKTKGIDKGEEEEKVSSGPQSLKVIPDEAVLTQKTTYNKQPMSAGRLDERPTRLKSLTPTIKLSIADEILAPQKSPLNNKTPMSISKLDGSPMHMRPMIPIVEHMQLNISDEIVAPQKSPVNNKTPMSTSKLELNIADTAPLQKSPRNNKAPMSASKLDESPIHMRPVIPIIEDIQFKSQKTIDLSQGNSPFTPNRSPNGRRRASGGLNLQQIQQETVKKTFRFSQQLTLSVQISSLLLFMIIVYIALALIDSIITYPFERKVLHLWIGQFLHGIALGILSFGVLKIMIRRARNKNQKNEEKALGPADKNKEKENDADINLFGFFLIGVSGFATVLFVNSVHERWYNAFTFVGLEIAVIAWNTLMIWIFFAYKNHHDSKVIEEKQKKGFFFVPIYKFFMTDLKNTKKELTTNPDNMSPTSKTKGHRKEEGIDKFKPKRSFEIITLTRVFGSQVLLLVLYVEFLAVVGFIKLYNYLQEKDQVYAAIPLVLVFPLLIYAFYKLVKLVDLKARLEIMLQASYMNTAFGAMFFRAAAFNIRNLDFLWLILAFKVSYKLGLYVIYGCRIQFWKDLTVKIKARFNKKPDLSEVSGSVLRPFSSIIELSRIDTLTSKQMKAFEQEEDTKKETSQTQTKRFVMRFILIQTSDILFNIASLVVFICYRWDGTNYASLLLNREDTNIYFKATWIELVTEVGISLVVFICWTFSKAYNYLSLDNTFSYFFRKLAVDFSVISFPLLLSYLFMLRL